MNTSVIIPNGLAEINEVYGNPDKNSDFIPDEDFIRENLVKVRLPFPLRLSWNLNLISRNIYAHKLATEKMCIFFDSVAGYYGGFKELQKKNYDIWGGAYQFREKRKKGQLSTHAWGIAFDYLPHLGRFGKQSVIPDEIVSIGNNLGFENGGHWSTPDGMHFQLCRDY